MVQNMVPVNGPVIGHTLGGRSPGVVQPLGLVSWRRPGALPPGRPDGSLGTERIHAPGRRLVHVVSDPIAAGLASAYFLGSLLFAGFVVRAYVDLGREVALLRQRVEEFKYLEEQAQALYRASQQASREERSRW